MKKPPEIKWLAGKGFPSLESLKDRFERAVFCFEPLRRFAKMAPETFTATRQIILRLLTTPWTRQALPSRQKGVSLWPAWQLDDETASEIESLDSRFKSMLGE